MSKTIELDEIPVQFNVAPPDIKRGRKAGELKHRYYRLMQQFSQNLEKNPSAVVPVQDRSNVLNAARSMGLKISTLQVSPSLLRVFPRK